MTQETEKHKKLLAFVEEAGMIFENFGISGMSGRLMGWLLVCSPAHQSAGQLAEALQASKGSISAATKYMIHIGFVERFRMPGDRKTYYRLVPNLWVELGKMRDQGTMVWRKFAERGIELLADEPLEVKERLIEMHHIHTFYERERPKLLERWKKEWEAYKKENF